MMQNEKNKTSDLKKIPGVGVNMEQHLQNIGIHCIADLRGKAPEELYRLDCMKKGFQDDRCVLYIFRCAVYFAEHEQHEPEKLKWWYWKDKDYPERCEKSDGTDKVRENIWRTVIKRESRLCDRAEHSEECKKKELNIRTISN